MEEPPPTTTINETSFVDSQTTPLVDVDNPRRIQLYTEERRSTTPPTKPEATSVARVPVSGGRGITARKTPLPPPPPMPTTTVGEGKLDNVGYRLATRKDIVRRRTLVCDLALVFAIIGIVVMIVETELCVNAIIAKHGTASTTLKLLVTLSTCVLLVLVVWYHLLDVRLFMCDNSLDDWLLAWSWARLGALVVELVVCAVHPPPSNLIVGSRTRGFVVDGDPAMADWERADVYLSIPMFARGFLVGRVVLLHSRLYTDASSQSLGALNRISFNTTFIFRSTMNVRPAFVLCAMMTSALFVATWLLHACDGIADDDDDAMTLANSMWLVAITFLTIGFGDFVPQSYCGRAVCVLTGMFGAGCTALVVAVLARKLELSLAEKYVHSFVLDVELGKRYRIAAANIVKAGWLLYKNRRMGRAGRVRHYQRRLLRAIHAIREVKHEQRKSADAGISVVEVFKAQNSVVAGVRRLMTAQTELRGDVDDVVRRLYRIERQLDVIVDRL